MSHGSSRLRITGAPTDSLQITELTPQQIEGKSEHNFSCLIPLYFTILYCKK